MFGAIARKLFGTANSRVVKKLQKVVPVINGLEPQVVGLSDADLQARTDWLRGRLANGESHDDILPDAFATVREAAKRVLGQRHFDTQMMGGMVLHQGKIAEMRTGEGKTLVATLAVYLNALEGKGVHVVTVNDYLAYRDSEWMGRVYRFLGLSVGCIVHGLTDDERRAAYAADVTYGTNNEFGFDYLRDNMKYRLDDMVQRPFNFAIVDEVDSILIDEARTPLIISGPSTDSSEMYIAVDRLIPMLTEGDFEKDEKHRTVALTEAGQEHIEQLLEQAGLLKGGGLYDVQNVAAVHHVQQALRAHTLFQRDKEYIVKDDKVVIIDEFTGRARAESSWKDGLHQAVEAKEGIEIQAESQSAAGISRQRFYKLYEHLCGMTGTALDSAGEFWEVFRLPVVPIPRHRPSQAKVLPTRVFTSEAAKLRAIVADIAARRAHGQPVLVGTRTIGNSERLSEALTLTGIPHRLLNARQDAEEAAIIAEAGQRGAVTIATNMAGRGTHITLGEEELAGGGLHVIALELEESRRIDLQLTGRGARQGQPGSNQTFLSAGDFVIQRYLPDEAKRLAAARTDASGEVRGDRWESVFFRAQAKAEKTRYETRQGLLRHDDWLSETKRRL